MPITDEGYTRYTEDEIFAHLKSDFESRLGRSVEPGDLVEDQLRAEAKTLAENQEAALERVYNAAYLSDAEGEELDKLVSLIMLTRREAVPATGICEFSRDSIPGSDYTIAKSTELQTGGSSPIEFETTEQNTLRLIDNFEDNLNEWSGDTGSFSLNTSSPISGSASLEVPATSGVKITTDVDSFKIGTTFNLNLSPNSGSIKTYQFGIKDTDNYYEVIVDTSANDLRLRKVKGGSEVSIQTKSGTIPTGELSHLEIDWSLLGDLRATLYDTDSRDSKDLEVTLAHDVDWTSGAFAISSNDDTATALVDDVWTSVVTSNIEAQNGGEQTNVGPDTITVAQNGLTGIETITNPVATGDNSYVDTNTSGLILGQDREGDEELRERAFENNSIGGAASVSALGSALGNLDGVYSVTIKRNRENTSVNGLPATSYEPIVYGGQKEDIAEVLHKTAAIDSQDVGGVNGTEVTYDYNSDVTGATETYHWSKPTEDALDITLDLVVDDNYINDEEVRQIVVNYIGGTDIDGSQVGGLDNGEDVYEAVMSGRIVDPDEHGIWEVDAITIDSSGDGTDDTTTTSSGADIYAVPDDKVAITNARDGSITVNTATK